MQNYQKKNKNKKNSYVPSGIIVLRWLVVTKKSCWHLAQRKPWLSLLFPPAVRSWNTCPGFQWSLSSQDLQPVETGIFRCWASSIHLLDSHQSSGNTSVPFANPDRESCHSLWSRCCKCSPVTSLPLQRCRISVPMATEPPTYCGIRESRRFTLNLICR